MLALPPLIGCLVCGTALALVFVALERRHAAGLPIGLCLAGRAACLRRAVGTLAPALWLFVLRLGVLLSAVLQAATHL